MRPKLINYAFAADEALQLLTIYTNVDAPKRGVRVGWIEPDKLTEIKPSRFVATMRHGVVVIYKGSPTTEQLVEMLQAKMTKHGEAMRNA